MIVTAAFNIHKIRPNEHENLNTDCEEWQIVSSEQSSKPAINVPIDFENGKKNSVKKIEEDTLHQLLFNSENQLEHALTTELSSGQLEVLAEIPEDFEFIALAQNLHLLHDVVLRITNLELSSDTRKYLISLLNGLPSRAKEEAIELLLLSHRDEDKLIAIELLSAVEDHVKPKILSRLLSESLSETLLSSLMTFSKNQNNRQVLSLVSNAIQNRFFAVQDTTRKLQLLSISAFPDEFREDAFSIVLKSLKSEDVKNQQLGYVIAKNWVGSSEEKLTTKQVRAILDVAKSVLNDTSLPVEQRLASLQLLEVMPNV